MSRQHVQVEEALNSVIGHIVLLSANQISPSPETLRSWYSQLDLARLRLLEDSSPRIPSPCFPESSFGSTGE